MVSNGGGVSPFYRVPSCFKSCSCSLIRLDCIFHVVMVHSALHVHVTVIIIIIIIVIIIIIKALFNHGILSLQSGLLKSRAH